MGDLDRTKESSSPVGITGGDEQYVADVVEEFGTRKLRVKSDTNISSDLVIETEFNVNTALSDSVFTTIFTKTAPVSISGLIAKFSSQSCTVKLDVDGSTIFEETLENLRSLVDLQSYVVPDGVYLKYKSDVRTFFYVPRFPQDATTNITFSAKADPGKSVNYVSGIYQVS